jgi:hypothetical protein
MKRAHRRWHSRLWASIAPLLAVLLALAWWSRVPTPVEAALPAALVNTPAPGR